MNYNDFTRKLARFEISEMFLPYFALGLGIWFLCFDVLGNSPAFAAAKFWENQTWGAVFLVVGILQAASVLLNRLLLRQWSLLLTSALWLSWFSIIVGNRLSSTGVVVYGGLFAVSYLTYWRLRHK